ncbi:paired amphipathic helix [Armillaria nabsnona]|nr:paired amphipathic helix [Armillaria nabsnona]
MDVDIKAIAGPSLSSVTTRQNSSRSYLGHNSPPPKLDTPTDVTSGPATPNQAAGPSSMIRSSDETPVSVLDALRYLYAIRDQFPDKPEVYNRFLDIIRDCKNELIDIPSAVEQVAQLFHQHPRLIGGFNAFVPPEYRVDPFGQRTIGIHIP